MFAFTQVFSLIVDNFLCSCVFCVFEYYLTMYCFMHMAHWPEIKLSYRIVSSRVVWHKYIYIYIYMYIYI